MGKRTKRSFAGVDVGPPKKTPAVNAEASRSTAKDHPTWRVRTMDTEGPWAWPPMVHNSDSIDTNKLCEIRRKLGDFETMTWREIEGKRHHLIDRHRLSPKARKRLADLKRDDKDEVFSFALQGEERVIAIRVAGVAELLWWDPNHEVCPSKKKHT